MFQKVLGFSTAIILAGCLIEGNSYPSIAANTNETRPEFYQSLLSTANQKQGLNSYQIAQVRTYRVRLGDTLGGIANRFGMSLNRLLNYNPQLRSRPNLIYIGETINLGGGGSTPVSTARPSGGKYYKVRRGDTLGGIAIRHGLSFRTILNYNPQLASRPNNIRIGERINVGSAQIIRRTPPTRPRKPTPTRPTNTGSSSTTQPTNVNTTSPSIDSQSRRSVAFNGLPTIRRQGSNNTGSKRGPEQACTQAGKNMRAIAPSNGLGFTYDDYPYFFWYFPGIESEPVPVIFTLIGQESREVNGKIKTRPVTVYEKELSLDQSGIVAFPLPAESQPLEEEQEYKWRIEIKCTPLTKMFLKYSIKRQSTDNPELIERLETAPVDQHPVIFAESGVWFDALKMIALQLQQAPEDPVLQEDWNEVLREIKFEDLIGEPIQYIEPNIQE